jgi:hypothetical protein
VEGWPDLLSFFAVCYMLLCCMSSFHGQCRDWAAHDSMHGNPRSANPRTHPPPPLRLADLGRRRSPLLRGQVTMSRANNDHQDGSPHLSGRRLGSNTPPPPATSEGDTVSTCSTEGSRCITPIRLSFPPLRAAHAAPSRCTLAPLPHTHTHTHRTLLQCEQSCRRGVS